MRPPGPHRRTVPVSPRRPAQWGIALPAAARTKQAARVRPARPTPGTPVRLSPAHPPRRESSAPPQAGARPRPKGAAPGSRPRLRCRQAPARNKPNPLLLPPFGPAWFFPRADPPGCRTSLPVQPSATALKPLACGCAHSPAAATGPGQTCARTARNKRGASRAAQDVAWGSITGMVRRVPGFRRVRSVSGLKRCRSHGGTSYTWKESSHRLSPCRRVWSVTPVMR